MNMQYKITDIVEGIGRIQMVPSVIYLFIATLILAPVYRLPYVNSGIVVNLKFIVLVFWVFGTSIFFLSCKMGRLKKRVFYYSKETLFFLILMMCYLCLMFFNSEHADMLSAKNNGFNEAVYSFVLAGMATITTSLGLNYKINFYKLLVLPASIIIILCVIHVAACLFKFDHYLLLPSFSRGAYAYLKTTWSHGIALYVILIPVYVSTKTTSNIRLFSSFIYGSLPIIMSQLVAGGRAALFASFFAATAWMIHILPVKYVLLFFTLLAIVVILFIDTAYFIKQDAVKISEVHVSNYSYYNKLMSRRLDHWMFGLGIIKDSPLIGVGVGNADIAIPGHQEYGRPIHNTLLRLTAELGLFFLIIVILHFMYVIYLLMRISSIITSFKSQYRYRKSYRTDVIYIRSSVIIMISALLISLFEPKYVWAGLGSSWLFWIMASILIFHAKNVWISHSEEITTDVQA